MSEFRQFDDEWPAIRAVFGAFLDDHPEHRANVRQVDTDRGPDLALNRAFLRDFTPWAIGQGLIDPDRGRAFLTYLRDLPPVGE